jgi:serine/threonine-protein kinase
MTLNLASGMRIAERFRLGKLLGQGGMGVVWRAYDERLFQSCAVKFIEAEASNHELRERFAREARAAASLKSAHVVQILDHGEWNGIPYLAMELLDGEDLAHRLHRLGRLSSADTFRIASHVAQALGKAHSRQIIHRDLKPENIFLVDNEEELVTRATADGSLFKEASPPTEPDTAKVLDFGIAKVRDPGGLSQGNTSTGTVMGTLHYMSPEQARGDRDIDRRSDLWSLAVIVFECLTGQKPFQGEFGEVFVAILAAPLPVPSHICPDLPPGFDLWWQRAASRERQDRFASAREMIEALGQQLGLVSPRVSLPDQSGAWPVAGPEERVRLSLPSLPEALLPEPRPSLPSAGLPSVTGVVSPVADAPFPSLPRHSLWPWVVAGGVLLLGGGSLLWGMVLSPRPDAPAAGSGLAAPASAIPIASLSSASVPKVVPVASVLPSAVSIDIASLPPAVPVRPLSGRSGAAPRPVSSGSPARLAPPPRCDEFGICSP